MRESALMGPEQSGTWPLVMPEENNGGAGQGTEGKLGMEAHGGPSLHTVGEEINRF